MPILVRNVRLELDQPEENLLAAVARKLRVPPEAIRQYSAVRRSLDARRSADIHFVYHVEVSLDESAHDEAKCVDRLHSNQAVMLKTPTSHDPSPGNDDMQGRPVIVGFGPAGMFAALRLAEFGYSPIVLERGTDVRRRHKDILQKFYREHQFNPQSNLLFGEGGAGTYSDGKLYTRVHDPLVRTVLESFYRHGAAPEILTDARPHIGSDRLPTICRRIREHIQALGGDVRFDSQLDDLTIQDGRISHVVVNGTTESVGTLILAIGHSARDTIQVLHQRGVRIEPRPFQLGVRIEHPQSLVDTWQYGCAAGHGRLPPAEYHVVAKEAGGVDRNCYSFCMCPGGMILPTNEDHGLIATNGASQANRRGTFANSGLVVTFPPIGDAADPLRGIEFQKRWERAAFNATGKTYRVPAQRATDFLARRNTNGSLETSYPFGAESIDIRSVVPTDVAEAVTNALQILDKKMPGFAGEDGLVTAPETRVSSTIRIVRDNDTRAAISIENMYPTGEGAGYAGGIASAAVDGIKAANAIIQRYKQPS
jgi:uncharacterized protein